MRKIVCKRTENVIKTKTLEKIFNFFVYSSLKSFLITKSSWKRVCQILFNKNYTGKVKRILQK
jgi:hypothetical protein